MNKHLDLGLSVIAGSSIVLGINYLFVKNPLLYLIGAFFLAGGFLMTYSEVKN